MGSLSKKWYKDRHGEKKQTKTYYYRFYHNGKLLSHATGEQGKRKALAKGKLFEAKVTSKKVAPVSYKVTFNDLVKLIQTDYELNQYRSWDRVEASIKNLSSHFENYTADEITTNALTDYIKNRLKVDQPGTINRELSSFRRMFTLAAQQHPPLIATVPHFKMLKENNVRTGFLEHDEYMKLKAELPEYLKAPVELGYKRGMRRSEILNLTWDRIFPEDNQIKLESTDTKNKEPRIIPLDKELSRMFEHLWMLRKDEDIPYIFLNMSGTGKIITFRTAWSYACKRAGLGYGYRMNTAYVTRWQDEFKEGPLFHDLRRTAVRNMIRSGISEVVAMRISGHKTRSVFDRYNIVSEDDLHNAADAMENYLNRRENGVYTTCLVHTLKPYQPYIYR